MNRLRSLVLAACVLAACSGGDDLPPDAGMRGYGDPCTTNEWCDSKLCAAGVCTKTCRKQADCPAAGDKAFDCGEVAPGKVACYPRTYRTGTGTTGHDCSLDGKCASGFSCLGQVGGADRYCSAKCKTDMDCPTKFRCSRVRVAKTLETASWCRPRQFCHPCVIDDQCGNSGEMCIKDVRGNGYCSQPCTLTGTSCPPFAKCENAGNNKLQCKHRAGFCYRSFKSEGGLCDPCIAHGWTKSADGKYTLSIAEEGVCKKEGFCFVVDRYTGEGACITPCGAGDSCPSSKYGCMNAESLGGKFCVSVDSQGYLAGCYAQ